jgi:hypothetical protein
MSAQDVRIETVAPHPDTISLPITRRLSIRNVRDKVQESASAAQVAISTRLFGLLTVLLISLGWLVHEEQYYTPEEGIGYWFGIVGGSLMLALLLYPLRKKIHFMRSWGSVRHWFQVHMVFGVLGPLFILYHCNFQLGAVNSNVAFFAMLLVMGSGIIGRYIFVRINYTLHGEQVTVQELQRLTGISRSEMEETAYITPGLKDFLEKFEQRELGPAGDPIRALLRLMTLGRRASWIQYRTMGILRQTLAQQAKTEGWYPQLLQSRLDEDKELIHAYLQGVRRLAEFSAYRKIFAWWHILHIPLFLMLVVTGIVHVVAVHLY